MLKRLLTSNKLSTVSHIRSSNTNTRIAALQLVVRNKSAYAFDIDGVLLKSHHAIPKAREALIQLKKNNIPFLCLTNGGGVLEEAKTNQLNRILELPTEYQLTCEQMILSHTPFQEFAKDYKDKNVLIVGGYDCLNVARSYGFDNAIHVNDYHKKYPFVYSIFPPRDITKDEYESMKKLYNFNVDPKDAVSAVLFMYESDHLGRDIQIVMDLVLANNGIPGHTEDYNLVDHQQNCKLIMSNADFLYSSSFSWPRFGQGMIKLCLKNIYRELTQRELNVTQYGKPEKVTFDFCQKRLEELAKNQGISEPLETIYMVGDNLLSDIKGANQAGAPWKSVLVKTGLYKGELDHEKPAHYITPDAFSFVMEHS